MGKGSHVTRTYLLPFFYGNPGNLLQSSYKSVYIYGLHMSWRCLWHFSIWIRRRIYPITGQGGQKPCWELVDHDPESLLETAWSGWEIEEIFSKQIKEVSVTQTWLIKGTLTSLLHQKFHMTQQSRRFKGLGENWFEFGRHYIEYLPSQCGLKSLFFVWETPCIIRQMWNQW